MSRPAPRRVSKEAPRQAQKARQPQNPAPASSGNYQQECLKAHNKYRAFHGCPPLTINTKLTSLAEAWAQDLARREKMEHRPKCSYGENIYFASDMEVSGERPVEMWYSEISKCNFKKSEFSPMTGHFTQLIWKATKEVGIGIAKKDRSTWVVAYYDPPGNVVGQFKEMVPPKISQ